MKIMTRILLYLLVMTAYTAKIPKNKGKIGKIKAKKKSDGNGKKYTIPIEFEIGDKFIFGFPSGEKNYYLYRTSKKN